MEDVLPSFYENWDKLTKEQSSRWALGVTPISSEGWLRMRNTPYYVVEDSRQSLGVIKGQSEVELSFLAHHGLAFNKNFSIQYRLVLIFDLIE